MKETWFLFCHLFDVSLVFKMIINDAVTTIVIVGAGFSGSLVATHLLRSANRPLLIQLIDRYDHLGKGVAYSTNTKSHLLNVPVGKMSAFPDDPNHLMRWLQDYRHELKSLLPDNFNEDTFIPRQVYGLYIQSILAEAEGSASTDVKLERLTDEVVAIQANNEGGLIFLKSQRTLKANKIVLALGNCPAPAPLLSSGDALTTTQPSYLKNAFSLDVLAEIEPDARILFIGTGLMMVDMVMSLWERQHRGKLYAVSRRGLCPLTHQSTQTYPPFLTPETAPKTVRGLWRCIRQEVDIAREQGYDWRAVIDSLRPVTQAIWQQLPAIEQQRFLRHGTAYWEVHRHRMAPEIWETVQTILNSGQLMITAGRIRNCQVTPTGVAVTVHLRRTQSNRIFEVDWIVNCAGIGFDYRQSQQLLINSLQTQGLIRPNAMGLGLDTTADGAILDAQENVSNFLYTLGSPRKGDLWETTAVRELREQAQTLAITLRDSIE